MQEYFVKLLRNLEPTDTFSDIIETRHAAVRSQLAAGAESHLIGSLQRKTRIQPLPNQSFDIDILVEFGAFGGWTFVGGITAPATIQHLLGRALESDRYAVKNPTPDAPTVTLTFADNVKVELVPAFRDNVGYDWNGKAHYPKGRAYWVPNASGIEWMLADYDFDADYITNANRNCNGRLVPVVKILKAIRRYHFPQLKSFALEMLAARNLPYLLSAYLERGLAATYPGLVSGFFHMAQGDLLSPIAIPGSLSASITLSASDAASIGTRFAEIKAGIEKAERTGQAAHLAYWRMLVGDPFPASV